MSDESTTVASKIREAAAVHAVKRSDDERRKAGDLYALALALEECGITRVADLYRLKHVAANSGDA